MSKQTRIALILIALFSVLVLLLAISNQDRIHGDADQAQPTPAKFCQNAKAAGFECGTQDYSLKLEDGTEITVQEIFDAEYKALCQRLREAMPSLEWCSTKLGPQPDSTLDRFDWDADAY